MGVSLAEHSFWSFRAAVAGWRAAHRTEEEKPRAPTGEEHDALVEKYG
jgi:hypothetical protein